MSEHSLNEGMGMLAAYLSSWNHVMGPQMLFCWRVECSELSGAVEESPREHFSCRPHHFLRCHKFLENAEEFMEHNDAPQLRRVSMVEAPYNAHILQVMHGYLEHCRSNKGTDWPTRTCLLSIPEREAIIHSVCFTLGAARPLCLSLILDYANVLDVWNVVRVADNTLARCAVLCKSSQLPLIKTMNALTCLLNQYFELSSKLLKTRYLDKMGASCLFAKLCSVSNSSTSISASKFMRSVVHSHVTTHGRTVVIGDNHPRINQFLLALTPFTDHTPLSASLWCVEPNGTSLGLQPALHLQGLLKNSKGIASLSMKEMVFSPYATTVVDLNQQRVFASCLSLQTPPEKERARKKLKTVPVPPADSQVGVFVHEICRVAQDERAPEALASAYRLWLQRKAHTLIRCAGRSRQALSMKYLQNILALPHQCDFEMVVACAETIQPGLRKFLQP